MSSVHATTPSCRTLMFQFSTCLPWSLFIFLESCLPTYRGAHRRGARAGVRLCCGGSAAAHTAVGTDGLHARGGLNSCMRRSLCLCLVCLLLVSFSCPNLFKFRSQLLLVVSHLLLAASNSHSPLSLLTRRRLSLRPAWLSTRRVTA
jgi:hypothetical protein